MYEDNIRDFKELMRKEGVEYNGPIYNDGEFHRFPGIGKSKSSKAGWYIFYGDHGSFGDWSHHLHKNWVSQSLSNDQYAQQRMKIKFEGLKKKVSEEEARERAEKLNEDFNNLSIEGSSDYLIRKCISINQKIRYGKQNNENNPNPSDDSHQKYIAIPIRDIDGNLCCFEKIYDDGSKKTSPGGIKKGNFFTFGEIRSGSLIDLTEGFATGASMHQASGEATCVVFGFNNFGYVIENLKKKYPYCSLRICGDLTDIKKTEELAKKYDILAIFPKFNPDAIYDLYEGTQKDWNDLHILEGIEEVKKQIEIQKPIEDVILDASQWLKIEIKKRQIIVDPIIQEKSLTMIYAARGIGKTYVALNVGLSVANAWPIFGAKWKVETPHKVLYVDGEMPAENFKERIVSLVSNKSEFYEVKHLENFISYNLDLQNSFIPDLSKKEGQNKIERILDKIGDVKLLILDNLSCLFRSGNDNDSENWNPIQEWLIKLRSSGLSVVLIHHSNKTGGQRGTSKREDVLDTVISLEHPIDYKAEQGARFEVSYTKNRGFFGEKAKPFEVWLKKMYGKLDWFTRDLEDCLKDRIVQACRVGILQKDIPKAVGTTDIIYVNQIIRELKETGQI